MRSTNAAGVPSVKICVGDCMIIEANGNWDPSSGDDLRIICVVRYANALVHGREASVGYRVKRNHERCQVTRLVDQTKTSF